MHFKSDNPNNFAISIKDFIRRVPWGRTKTYQLIRAGKLKVRKVGRSTVVLPEDIESFFRSLP